MSILRGMKRLRRARRSPRPQAAPIRALDTAWRPLGEILIDRGLITPTQLETALAAQRREGRRLGEILFVRGWLSGVDLRDALAEQHGLDLSVEPATGAVAHDRPGTFPLGRLLVRRGHISEAQLADALAEQRETGARLGQILISNGAVSAFVLASALAEQEGLVGASEELWAVAQASPDDSQAWYEVRELERGRRYRLYASRSFLDATDLALAVLHEWNPEELHVTRVEEDAEEELCWRYPAA